MMVNNGIKILEETIYELIEIISNNYNYIVKPVIDFNNDRTKINELVISSEKNKQYINNTS